MKTLKTIFATIIFLLMVQVGQAATLFHGQPTSLWSADKTASALIASGPCVFHGIVVNTDGTNAVTISIYDSTTATGTTKVLPASTVIPAMSYPYAVGVTPPTVMTNGIYVSVSVAGGGSVKYTVEYDQ